MTDLYPDLIRLLLEAGCEKVRQGRGDHEIWRSPKAVRPFTVDRSVKSRHTANAVLKQEIGRAHV
jgi:predicted RNA binding protein YcfA (HicA-like mRNA interferase family)